MREMHQILMFEKEEQANYCHLHLSHWEITWTIIWLSILIVVPVFCQMTNEVIKHAMFQHYKWGVLGSETFTISSSLNCHREK